MVRSSACEVWATAKEWSWRGAAIEALLAIRNPERKLIGVALSRENREQFCIWIDGDEFHWGPASALRNHDWLTGWEPEIERPLAI